MNRLTYTERQAHMQQGRHTYIFGSAVQAGTHTYNRQQYINHTVLNNTGGRSYTYIHTVTCIHAYSDTYIHIDKHIHTYTHTDNKSYSQAYRHTYIQTDCKRGRQAYKHKHKHIYRQSYTQRIHIQ